MEILSVLRLEEHKALSTITLNGTVLDLGGDKGADYLSFIQGTHEVTCVNMNPKVKPDIFHDLEQPLPLGDHTYDNVLLINVLEHIFEYRKLLQESIRVLKSGGTVVVIVPFLFPVHPSPHDFHRYTYMTLQKECELLNLSNIKITTLGKGVFTARYLMLDRLLPFPLRLISFYTCRYCAYFADYLFVTLSKILGKKYLKEDYALGYCVTATK